MYNLYNLYEEEEEIDELDRLEAYENKSIKPKKSSLNPIILIDKDSECNHSFEKQKTCFYFEKNPTKNRCIYCVDVMAENVFRCDNHKTLYFLHHKKLF